MIQISIRRHAMTRRGNGLARLQSRNFREHLLWESMALFSNTKIL